MSMILLMNVKFQQLMFEIQPLRDLNKYTLYYSAFYFFSEELIVQLN